MTDTKQTDVERFRADVLDFMRSNKISATRFSRDIANSSSFVSLLMKGREPKTAVRQKMYARMAQWRPPAPKPQKDPAP